MDTLGTLHYDDGTVRPCKVRFAKGLEVICPSSIYLLSVESLR